MFVRKGDLRRNERTSSREGRVSPINSVLADLQTKTTRILPPAQSLAPYSHWFRENFNADRQPGSSRASLKISLKPPTNSEGYPAPAAVYIDRLRMPGSDRIYRWNCDGDVNSIV
jgi:hypothetical protein